MKRTPASPPPLPRKRILLVDDHPLMREGIAQWIQRAPDLEVCGQADSAAAAVKLAEKLGPDLVLTDISLDSRNGLELIKDLHARLPKLPVLVLSMHDESLYAGRALRAGARGYIMKRAGGDSVVEGIRTVLKGGYAVSPSMATHLLEEYSGRKVRQGRSPVSLLTDREFEVLQLFGEAKTNREVAAHLNLSPKTIETHRLNIMRKLSLKNSAELMRFALQSVEQEASSNPWKA